MRSRWAAIGAAVAVSVGAGGLFVASAADSDPAVFVAVTPVRVVDTRVALGLPAALVSTDGELVQITGTIDTIDGNAQVVPAGATALVANVTAVLPTAGGFLSVRPGDAAGDPSTSSLNFLAGKTTPNSVTVQLSAVGDIAVYYRASGGDTGDTTHFLVDIVGYYIEGAAGPVGPQGDPGPAGVPGDPGAVGDQGDMGPMGPQGPIGPMGPQGPTGPQGDAGVQGDIGPMGPDGPAGQDGLDGSTGPEGPAGQDGLDGDTGPIGPQGPMGPAGTTVAAQFYALMPNDNAFTVASNTDVEFPHAGPSTAGGLIVGSGGYFILVGTGVYQITYRVPATEAGQLAVTRNGVVVDYTVAGRATGTTTISSTVLIDGQAGDIITIRNVGFVALTITPFAGGIEPSAATLLIEYIGTTPG